MQKVQGGILMLQSNDMLHLANFSPAFKTQVDVSLDTFLCILPVLSPPVCFVFASVLHLSHCIPILKYTFAPPVKSWLVDKGRICVLVADDVALQLGKCFGLGTWSMFA